MAGLNLKDLARRGAVARLAELQAEVAAILKAFPELSRGVRVNYTDDGVSIATPGRKRRRRKPMTAAQKRAVGIRMKKYWAARRKAKSA